MPAPTQRRAPRATSPARPTGVRLQRVLADAGIASRRECEAMIEAGRVEVNGQLMTRLPVFVDPRSDQIKVDGRIIKPRGAHARVAPGDHAPPPAHVYVMLNKPERTLTTTRDDSALEGNPRRTVLDLVAHPSGARLYPVGRLDYHTTGLVLLTSDGELTQRLTHARYQVPQTYRVWIEGDLRPDTLDMLRRRVGQRDLPDGGVRAVEDGTEGRERGARNKMSRRTRGELSDVDNGPRTNQPSPAGPRRLAPGPSVIEITLRPGKRESIADMLLATGCGVRKVTRVGIGPLVLRGLAAGKWRDLSPDELAELKAAAGLARTRKPPSRRAKKTPETR